MELLQLKYFQIIAQKQHISNAAKELHISQPSLSQMLSRLEKEIGYPLFKRVGRQIYLNEEGSILLKYVNQIFDCIESASEEIKAQHDESSKKVKLCVSSASYLIKDFVPCIQQQCPRITLQILQHQEHISSKSDYDLALYSSHLPPTKKEDLILLTEEIKLAIFRKHPLADKPFLDKKDLIGVDFLSLSETSNLGETLNFYYQTHQFFPKITTFCDSPNTLRDLLTLGFGAAFVPSCTWHDFGKDQLTLLSIRDMPMKRYLILSLPKEPYQREMVTACKKALIDFFTKYNLQFQE